MKKIAMLFIVLAIVFSLSACAPFGIISDVATLVESDDTAAAKGELLESEDGRFSLLMPDTWKEAKDEIGNEDADLAIKSDYRGAYVLVLNEAKADMTYSFEEWKEVVQGITIDVVENPQVSDPAEIDLNGYPAIQQTITGTIDNMNIEYFITYIDGEEYYGQIVCWSLVSDFENAMIDFEKIVESVKGI